MIRIIAGIVVVILAFLIGRILIQGLPHISWKFLTTSSKAFTSGGGIGIQLFNSFYLLILTLIISFPISLGAGIFWLNMHRKMHLRTSFAWQSKF